MSKRFKSQDYFRYPRLGTKWRRPKGRQSKLRKKKGGSGMLVSMGYGTSKKSKFMIDGARFTIVRTMKDLKGAEDAVIISSSLGGRKTKAIAEKARQLNLRILNMKKVLKAERTEKMIAVNKELRKKRKEKKAKAVKARKEKEKGKEPKSEAKPEAKTDAKLPAKAEHHEKKEEVKETETEIKAGSKSEAKPQTKIEKAEAQPEAKTEQKQEKKQTETNENKQQK
jgi:large subunit ribosomal protein L32e